jgi:hypothetical protein
MSIARKTRKTHVKYVPVLDSFDYEIDPQDPHIDWAELKKSVIESAIAQFNTVKVILVLSPEDGNKQSALDANALYA